MSAPVALLKFDLAVALRGFYETLELSRFGSGGSDSTLEMSRFGSGGSTMLARNTSAPLLPKFHEKLFS